MSGLPLEFRKFARNCEGLKRILNETQQALDQVKNNKALGRDIKEQLFKPSLVEPLRKRLERTPAFVVFGQTCQTKATFVNILLDQQLLPLFSQKWRWIKVTYGCTTRIRLALGDDIEIVEKLKGNERIWVTIPDEDLTRDSNESPKDHCPTLEVQLSHSLLAENVNIVVPPDCDVDDLPEVIDKHLDRYFPILVYCFTGNQLNETNIQEIKVIKEKFIDQPILFVSIESNKISEHCSTESLTESEQHQYENGDDLKVSKDIENQLIRLGFLSESENNTNEIKQSYCKGYNMDNILISDSIVNKEKFHNFIRAVLRINLFNMSTLLSEIHNSCLRIFILTAFDMAREIQITPRRIKYAQEVELKLYKALMKLAIEKQAEITRIINVTLREMNLNIEDLLNEYNHRLEAEVRPVSLKMATMELHQLVLKKLSSSVSEQLVQSVSYLQESFTGTLQRCLESLENNCNDSEGMASDAVNKILTAAYNIDLKSSPSFSFLHTFIDRLRKLMSNFQLPWTTCSQPQFHYQWQESVVRNIIVSLSSSKMTRIISTQFQEHVKSSHEAFQIAMRSLENQLSSQLEQTEEQRIAIRKRHAPRFARLALESTSLCDLVRWGMPKQLKEIGRGQYGVVFACESWGGINPCAVKSVVPPDERHWNDLAMEFYYTRTITEHPRIVKLRGSVIDHTYGGGNSPAVLLVMEKMKRDLYCGLRDGLTWVKRLQIAVDVVEGIRYLHSQGLVHRDIKLKNVLLDGDDRAKLTDFGFCIPEAMMSGSIVGTPIHMAPELLSGRYDSSVDVYAFGILFWYICAGQTRLPNHFEGFINKEQLWCNVRKGIRPECLRHFNDDCWNLMELCWSAEPSQRPLLGYVQPQLETIQKRALEEQAEGKSDLSALSFSCNSQPNFAPFDMSSSTNAIHDAPPLMLYRDF